MAKNVGKIKSQEVLELDDSAIGKIKNVMKTFRTEDVKGQTDVFVNAGDIRILVSQNKENVKTESEKCIFDSLLSRSGTSSGLCKWFSGKDVQVLLDVIG